MTFQAGNVVEWDVPKRSPVRGKIIAVVPPNTDPLAALGENGTYGCRVQFSAKLRPEVSYLVMTPKTKGSRQPNLTWPKVKALRLCEE